jgi:hypothetical protein
VVRGIGRLRLATVGILAVAGTGAFAAPSALADTFCVNYAGCPGTPEPTITAALAAAGANGNGKDRVQVGAGDYSEANLVANANNPVDLVGAGLGQTRIARPDADNQTTLELDAGTSIVADLSVRAPTGSGATGLRLTTGTAERVEITGSSPNTVGLSESGGIFRAGRINLPGTGSGGVLGSLGTVEGSEVTAATGVAGVRTLRTSRVTAGTPYIAAALPSIAQTIDDCLLSVPAGSNGIGIRSDVFLGNSTLLVRHTTVIGGGPGTTGVRLNASTTAGTVDGNVTLRSTLIRGFETDLSRTASGGGFMGADAKATIDVDYTVYDPGKTSSTNNSVPNNGVGSGSIVDGGHNLNLDPGFVNPGAGDYRLPYSSPVVDRGDPTSTASEPGVDLAGFERFADGNSDGSAISDMGAFEYQPAPPVATASASASSALVGHPVTFTGSATEPQGEPLGAQGWDFGDGQSAGTPAATHSYSAPGTYTATFTARDASGAAGRAAVTVTVTLPRTVVSGASVTNPVFTWGPGPTAISAAARRRATPKGTTFRFRLSQAATVKIALARVLSGRRVARRCLAPTRARRGRPRCTRYVAAGTLTRRNRPSGLNRVAFSGRLARRKLPAGRYRATITATVGGTASVPRRLFFRIVAR